MVSGKTASEKTFCEIAPHYLLVGDGRLANHLNKYFNESGIFFRRWSRKSNSIEEFRSSLIGSDLKENLGSDSKKFATLLLAISDSSLQEFIEMVRGRFEFEGPIVHFSGLHSFSSAIGLHPLGSFTQNLWERSDYEKIPFIGEIGGPTFSVVFPQLKNPSFQIDSKKKPLYHALCALAGGGSVILWQKLFSGLEMLGLPPEIAMPFIESITRNLLADSSRALTGPISRNDSEALSIHKTALAGDSYWKVYESLIEMKSPHLLQNLPKGEIL